MSKKKFTAKFVEHVSESKEHFDAAWIHRGSFGIKVSPGGSKSWFLYYRPENVKKNRRITLGKYPTLSLSEAREKAAFVIQKVAAGDDPWLEAKRQQVKIIAEPSMNDLWELYLKDRPRLGRKGGPKASETIKEEDRKWSAVVQPSIGNLKVSEIKRQHIRQILKPIINRGSMIQANRTFSFLHMLLSYAIGEHDMIEVHPMYAMKRPQKEEAPRPRVLSDDEIFKIWKLLDDIPPYPAAVFRLLLFTAQRPGEIMSMSWDDIIQDERGNPIWHQKQNKTDSPHFVPLSPPAWKILSSLPRVNEWVFPSTVGSSHITTVKRHRINMNQKMGYCKTDAKGIPRDKDKKKFFTEHDFRRTARTLLSRCEIKHHIRERCLNHSMGRIVGTYDLWDYQKEKRDALNKLSRLVNKILKNGIKAKVVEMRAVQ